MSETQQYAAPQDHRSAQFTWQAPDGGMIVLPRMGKLSAKLLRETRKLDAEDRMWTLLEKVASPDALARIDELDGESLTRLGEAWGETMGESTRSLI